MINRLIRKQHPILKSSGRLFSTEKPPLFEYEAPKDDSKNFESTA